MRSTDSALSFIVPLTHKLGRLMESRRSIYLRLAGVILATALAVAGIVYWSAGRALREAQQTTEEERHLRFTLRSLSPVVDAGFEWVNTPAVFAQAEMYEGHLFVIGPTGLSEYDQQGHVMRDFRAGRELPPSPLVKIARANLSDSREQELLIATKDAGVLAFNGKAFRQLLPELPEARSATAILPVASGHLLIGTEKRGLLLYDGRHLGSFHSTLAHTYVTELAGTESDLWVGTHSQGVSHWHGGQVDWFGEAEGLPDSRVYAIAVNGDRTYVGTSAGIAEFQAGRFARVLAPGAFVRALFVRDNTLLAGTMDDGVLEIPLLSGSRGSRQAESIADLNEVEQIFQTGDTLYAISARGVFARSGKGDWRRILAPAESVLADRNISALAFDRSGRLWVGYFDRGLDILDPSAVRARHIEDDHIFCVNRILSDARQNSTAVATANGLVFFDAQGTRRQVLGRNEGIIADHVTDIALYRDGLVAATPAGLTFMDSGGTRSLYAFHGLVNNHVYTLSANGPRLLAGTLGGASVLEGDEVRANYTTATSALKHNWITASTVADGEWWVGTYGAGIFRLDSNGRFEAAEGAAGEFVINPNAMAATGDLVAAGSMGRGLLVMNRNGRRWHAVTNGLPSLNVTALVAANGFLYVGTDNGLVRIPEQRLEQ